LTIHKITADGAEAAIGSPATFSKELSFPPGSAWAWEVGGK